MIRRIDGLEGQYMTSDPQGDLITALENFRNAYENGTLNPEIVRAVVEAFYAAR